MTTSKHIITSGLAITAGLMTAGAQAIALGKIENTTVTVGGYVKLDAMATDFSDGQLGAGNMGRDFYLPGLTPVDGTSENTTIDFHARQTRFNFGTQTDISGHTLKTFLELDFLGTPNGDERITNSYSPRVRHAYLTYDNWLFGQTWTTFQNVNALPETADFIGSTDFSIFVRQAQIRYTAGNFQIAVENPETTVTPFGGGDRITADDNELPDFVLRYNYEKDSLSLSAAVLLRQLTYNNGGAIDDSETSTGLSISGKWMLGKDDVRFGVNTGQGMGRYIGLNVANGAVIDAEGNLEAIDSTAWYVAFRHHWNAQWRSNITYSAIEIDNDTTLTGVGATKGTQSVRINLMHSPVANLTLAGEYARATREIESGAEGDMNRLQFSATLAF